VNTLLKTTAYILIFFSSIFTYAGDSGHGGGGYVCPQKDGTTNVVLVDIWEANLRVHLANKSYSKIPLSDADLYKQVNEALIRLSTVNKAFAEKVKKELQYIEQNYTEAPAYALISEPQDVSPDLGPRGCKLKGVATYIDNFWNGEGVLWIDMKHFNNMHVTHQAALFVHEAVYKVLRERSLIEINSVNTRKIVGILFSSKINFTQDMKYIKELVK